MITIFEEFNYKSKPEIGDYVIVKCNWPNNKKDEEYVNSVIGKIIRFGSFTDSYNIKFPIGFILTFPLNKIVAFSKNKEELEMILAAKNFNL